MQDDTRGGGWARGHSPADLAEDVALVSSEGKQKRPSGLVRKPNVGMQQEWMQTRPLGGLLQSSRREVTIVVI